MARNNLHVEVNEAAADGKRTITITVSGATDDFMLADLLAQRKAIPPAAAALKHMALEAVKNWLESAEQVIAGTRSEQKIAEDKPPKRDRKPQAPSAPNDTATRRVKPETGNSAIATTSLSGS